MIFLIDESGRFIFPPSKIAASDRLTVALVGGVAISEKNSQHFCDYLLSHFQHDNRIIKGRDIDDDTKIVDFIDEVIKKECFAVFSVGDYGHVLLANADEGKKDLMRQFKLFSTKDYPEYGMLDQHQKNILLAKLTECIDLVDSVHAQDYYNMLMIFETIRELLQKFLDNLHLIEEEFEGITIIIDTQVQLVQEIIKRDLLYYFLFVATRKTPLGYNKDHAEKLQNFLHKGYLDTPKLIKKVLITTDEENILLNIADYICSFTRKALRGTIVSRDVIDKLSILYGNKMPVNHFHHTQRHISMQIPKSSEYAIEKLLLKS